MVMVRVNNIFNYNFVIDTQLYNLSSKVRGQTIIDH